MVSTSKRCLLELRNTKSHRPKVYLGACVKMEIVIEKTLFKYGGNKEIVLYCIVV